jgi:phosphatidylserine decarboxylase
MRVAPDAYLPAAAPAGLAALAFGFGSTWGAAVLVAVALAVLLFFRDPQRLVPREPGLVVSPGDGRVVAVVPELLAGGQPTGRVRVSIFLSLFNVHINRSPVAATVTKVQYHPGGFLPAFDHKASERNEQNRIDLDAGGISITVVQIAGLIARRIVCRVRPGDRIERGERIGLIKFGSRVDLFLPATIQLRVKVGDRVQGASSVIGQLDGSHGQPA